MNDYFLPRSAGCSAGDNLIPHPAGYLAIMKNGVILLTGLLPTVGHEYLIRFASKLCDTVTVIVCTRDGEPLTSERMGAFYDLEDFEKVYVYRHHDNDAPQNPGDVPEDQFWGYWRDTIFDYCDRPDFIFASEPYGADLAKATGAKFIPVDMNREIFNVKGTDVRRNMIDRWNDIMQGFRERTRQTITFFGAESTGKSTITKKMGRCFPSYTIHEWARQYLEAVGRDLTDEKMETIYRGQFAAQQVVSNLYDRPFIFQDTDLLSTIGYYRIGGFEIPRKLLKLFESTKSDLYIVMNDRIKFTPDQLRYGGDKRESTTQFWIDLLEEFDCKYRVIHTEIPLQQQIEAEDFIMDHWYEKFGELIEFQRD